MRRVPACESGGTDRCDQPAVRLTYVSSEVFDLSRRVGDRNRPRVMPTDPKSKIVSQAAAARLPESDQPIRQSHRGCDHRVAEPLNGRVAIWRLEAHCRTPCEIWPSRVPCATFGQSRDEEKLGTVVSASRLRRHTRPTAARPTAPLHGSKPANIILRFRNCLERHAIADREELIPHREDARVLVRLFDRFRAISTPRPR